MKLYTILRNKWNVLLLACMALVVTTGCNDWLAVAPDNQINEEDMFKDGNGYRNSLNGIYIKLAGTSLYGRETSWGLVDVIGQMYNSKNWKSTATYFKAANYQWDDASVKTMISNIWGTAYNDIANCNNLINHVSVEDSLRFQSHTLEKNMIWGEALALRAFIHFDLMRLFAPSMAEDDKKAHLPYVDVYPSIATTYGTNTDFLKKVERDLTEARTLLATCDTTASHKVWMTTNCRMLAQGTTAEIPEDVFLAYRGFRMNYYAVTALLARVYLWQGDYEQAGKMAKEVIDATYDDSPLFDFAGSTDLAFNLKDYNSILFSLSSQTLTETYQSFISSDSDSPLVLDATTVFEDSKEDVRGTDMLGSLGGRKYSLKNTIAKSSIGSDMIPMIRLSEMYYIMAEYYANKQDWNNAANMLQTVRSARGILQQTLTITSKEQFNTELLKEVHKEFVSEGQLYFYYKRLNIKPATKALFVFDKPENEDI